MIIWISIAALISTFLGGIFALRFKDKLHLILGFSAGAIIGVAFFDLLPESHHGHPTAWTTFATVIGVAVLYIAIHLAGV
jgi:ZIP family zinc transporter